MRESMLRVLDIGTQLPTAQAHSSPAARRAAPHRAAPRSYPFGSMTAEGNENGELDSFKPPPGA
jgi:hypothetical protein